jgi:hypothetical protein
MTKKLIKVDRNGTKYFMVSRPCIRCGGAGGSDKWAYTGWTCYECGGTGQGKDEIVKEYTPEYEAKLEERRANRRAKWEAEHAEEIAEAKAKEEATSYIRDENIRLSKVKEQLILLNEGKTYDRAFLKGVMTPGELLRLKISY